MKILFSGGGTAGHILPIIALTRELRRISPENYFQFFYIGPRDEFSKILLSQEGIKVKGIVTGKIRRYLGPKEIFQNIIDVLIKIPIGFFQSFFHIFFLSPDVIFSKGGYGSFTSVLAGKILQVPIFLHESDIVPGLANRILSKFSMEIFVSFPIRKTEHFPLKKMIYVGNPVRKEILEGSKEKAKEALELSGEKPVVLILGGSQGAQRINDKILEILPDLLVEFEIIHQCGEQNYEQVKADKSVMIGENLAKYYHLFSFLKEEELKYAYAAADLIVSRAGSGSIFEIAALGKPSILIPLPESAQNHQLRNAYAYAEKGAALVMEEINFTPHFFLEKLKYLIYFPDQMKKMQQAAKEFAKPQAAKIIAEYIKEYLSF